MLEATTSHHGLKVKRCNQIEIGSGLQPRQSSFYQFSNFNDAWMPLPQAVSAETLDPAARSSVAA